MASAMPCASSCRHVNRCKYDRIRHVKDAVPPAATLVVSPAAALPGDSARLTLLPWFQSQCATRWHWMEWKPLKYSKHCVYFSQAGSRSNTACRSAMPASRMLCAAQIPQDTALISVIHHPACCMPVMTSDSKCSLLSAFAVSIQLRDSHRIVSVAGWSG